MRLGKFSSSPSSDPNQQLFTKSKFATTTFTNKYKPAGCLQMCVKETSFYLLPPFLPTYLLTSHSTSENQTFPCVCPKNEHLKLASTLSDIFMSLLYLWLTSHKPMSAVFVWNFLFILVFHNWIYESIHKCKHIEY